MTSIADQIKCKTHPTEYITNYCSKESCYTQLCATCICQHTQLHNRMGTKPQYENIKDTYAKTNENLVKYKQGLNKQKARIKNIMDSIQKRRKQVQKIFKQAKQDVMSIVQKTFSDLQKQFNDQLIRQKQKTGLLNETRLDQIYAQINKKSLDVYTMSQQLNNLRQASNIKKVNLQFIPKGIQFKQQISQQIATNQLFVPNVSYKSSFLQEVAGSLKRLISVSISYPVSGDFRPVRKTVCGNNINNNGNGNVNGNVSKTPNKDYIQQRHQQFSVTSPTQQGHALGINPFNRVTQERTQSFLVKNTNIDGMNMGMGLRSPGKYQLQNNRPNMRSTNKENAFWSKGGETGLGTGNGIGMKVFANTFAG